MATLFVLLTGKIVGDSEIEWNISPLPVEPLEGELQRLLGIGCLSTIDEAADTDAYEDDLLDIEFWSRGAW